MTIYEMRAAFGDTQSEFAERYNIPFRTIQNWEAGVRKPPEYVVALLGNHISAYDIREKRGLRFTDFNRTVTDALANESILDMQGITEALSRYYFTNGDSFEGIFVSPEYRERFVELADNAINYYENEQSLHDHTPLQSEPFSECAAAGSTAGNVTGRREL